MKRKFSITRFYDVFGPVKIKFEFAGDINEKDFDIFLREYICKKEKEKGNIIIKEVPRIFSSQVKKTLEGMNK